jgi:predicted RNA-binding protein associated with RNAse of E/G family
MGLQAISDRAPISYNALQGVSMSQQLRQIKSGEFGDRAYGRDYRYEHVGELFVERIIWARLPEPRRISRDLTAANGDIWYRFWLFAHDQVVERYYSPDGALLGTRIDLCAPLRCDEGACSTEDYVLDIWIDPVGCVTVHNEGEFEAALASGALTAEQGRQAEAHLRELTAGIARNRFPPPIVRNWKIDPSRLPGGERGTRNE